MNNYSMFLNQASPLGVVAGIGSFVLLVVVWSIFWKGWALWLAARRGEKWWFVILLIINTVGILEIIYIFAVAKRQDGVLHNDTTKVVE